MSNISAYTISAWVCFLLFWGLLAAAICGQRLGRSILLKGLAESGTGNFDAVVLSLFGLLIAFTFSNAYSRYEYRRELAVQEANAIGTAWLRMDLVPQDEQPVLRERFRDYVKTRAAHWECLSNVERTIENERHSQTQQLEVWNEAIRASQNDLSGDARKLLLPALNEVNDIATTRLIAVQSHPPTIIFIMLGLLALAAAWLAGFSMAKSKHFSWLHLIGFSCLACLAIYMIVDIEYPRFGFVTLDLPNELLADAASQLK